MPRYEVLSDEIIEKIKTAKETHVYPQIACKDEAVIRRKNVVEDIPTIWRPTFVLDIDKIIHCPFYNRYTDKTQVFSLWKNDDLTRRSLHVQLVSRISRTIGAALHLNLDLIEAIALGHDMGHPPFAHTGERYLDEISFKETGRHFYHNIHSVRVLDGIFPYNISLQTLNGIAAHNGEFECEIYQPEPLSSFEEFDRIIESCYHDEKAMLKMMPCTMEGAVVRLADIIAYLGKDRQDAIRVKSADQSMFQNDGIGSFNSEIINNLVVNIIENSYGKPYIKLDEQHFAALKKSKANNYAYIYRRESEKLNFDASIKPMMADIYGQVVEDVKKGHRESPVFKHHIEYVNRVYNSRRAPYEYDDPHQIAVDYIASMTDSYFIDLHRYLFPNSPLKVEYKGYFSEGN